MTVESRARTASQAVRARESTAPDFRAFLRHAAAARRRRQAAVVSLVIAALVGAALPLSRVYEDYGRIAPTQRGKHGVETPTPPRARTRSQGLGLHPGAEPRIGIAPQAGAASPGRRTETQADRVAGGGRIFYSSNGVWVMDADGSDRKQLAVGSKPDPSFDGRRVAFVRVNDECSVRSSSPNVECLEIWVMDDDGSDQRMVGRGDWPAWSPDGRRIAFMRWGSDPGPEDVYNGPTGDVYVMNADGSRVRLLAATHPDRSRPRWSPDGRWIAFASPSDGGPGCTGIYITEVDGPKQEGLDHGAGCRSGGPSWSPDGKQIAFFSSRGSNSFDMGIYVVNRDGSSLRRLTPTWDGDRPRSMLWPSWSPDGSRIAYTFDSDGAFTGGWYCRDNDNRIQGGGFQPDGCQPSGPAPEEIYVMNADGSSPRHVIQGRFPAFSP